MKVVIDADACPVTNVAEDLCNKYNIECIIVCDDSHVIYSDYAKVIVVEKGFDSADYKILSIVSKNDLVITNDYGLSALALAKECSVIDYNGKVVNDTIIDGMLGERAHSAKLRKAKVRTKNIKKRSNNQNEKFHDILNNLLAKY